MEIAVIVAVDPIHIQAVSVPVLLEDIRRAGQLQRMAQVGKELVEVIDVFAVVAALRPHHGTDLFCRDARAPAVDQNRQQLLGFGTLEVQGLALCHDLEAAEALDAQQLFLGFSPFDIIQLFLDRFGRDGFQQVARNVELDGVQRVLGIAGAEDDSAIGVQFHDLLRQLQTAHSAHTDVQKGNVNRVIFSPFQRRGASGELHYRGNVRRRGDRRRQRRQHGALVVHSHGNHGCSLLSFGMVMTAFVPLPGALSTVSVPPHMASMRPRILRIPMCSRSSSRIVVSNPTPSSTTLMR